MDEKRWAEQVKEYIFDNVPEEVIIRIMGDPPSIRLRNTSQSKENIHGFGPE